MLTVRSFLLTVELFCFLLLGNVSETPTPTTCLKSTAVHLQFVRQYVPHLYRRTFLASKLRRKGNPAVRLPFILQYASHLYCSTPPICTAVLLEKYWGWGHRNVSARVSCTFRNLFCTGATLFCTSARGFLLPGSKRPFAPSPRA